LRAGSVFGVLLTGGLVFALAVQAFVIGAGILRLIPLTGITLPFLSHGGTSLVTSAAAIGLVLRVSDEAHATGSP
jgi:cell division protein FtsW (lipid II flippase)